MDEFTFRGARSPSLLIALGTLVVIEPAAVHLLFVRAHPFVAWGMASSLTQGYPNPVAYAAGAVLTAMRSATTPGTSWPPR